MSASLSLVLPAVPEEVPHARAAIGSLCEQLGIDGALTQDIRLAVTEACANCALHSYSADAPNPTFELQALVVEDSLVMVVRDYGGGLLRGRMRAGLGVGLRLIEQLAEDAEVAAPRDGGLRVTMRFALRAARPALPRGLRRSPPLWC